MFRINNLNDYVKEAKCSASPTQRRWDDKNCCVTLSASTRFILVLKGEVSKNPPLLGGVEYTFIKSCERYTRCDWSLPMIYVLFVLSNVALDFNKKK